MGAISAVGGILPVLTGITTAVQAVDRTVGALQSLGSSGDDGVQASQDLAMKQLRQQQKLQEQQLSQKDDLARQQAQLQSAQDEEDRRQALRRAVARQRAEFGSSGISAGSGSSEAVLLGMFDESDEDREKREQMDALKNTALDLDESQNRSLNLLQATQLAQRQSLQRLYQD